MFSLASQLLTVIDMCWVLCQCVWMQSKCNCGFPSHCSSTLGFSVVSWAENASLFLSHEKETQVFPSRLQVLTQSILSHKFFLTVSWLDEQQSRCSTFVCVNRTKLVKGSHAKQELRLTLSCTEAPDQASCTNNPTTHFTIHTTAIECVQSHPSWDPLSKYQPSDFYSLSSWVQCHHLLQLSDFWCSDIWLPCA